MAKNRQSLVILGIAAAVVYSFFVWHHPIIRSYSALIVADSTDRSNVLNATLGFEKIFAIVLPTRQDRAKPLLAAANATNLNITLFDGVQDDEIPSTEIPHGWGTQGFHPTLGHLGCLTSHRRIWKRMIDENFASALVLESDVDWDMRVKESMLGLSDGVKALADFPFANHTVEDISGRRHAKDMLSMEQPTPYGNGWDILWLGHCGSNGGEDHRYYAYADPGAGDREHAWTYDAGPSPNFGPLVETRMVFQLRAVTCSGAYAISQRGARKLVHTFRTANSPFDMELKSRCLHRRDMVCLSTFPQVFSIAPSRSNIGEDAIATAAGEEKKTETEAVGAGYGLQISARVNAHMGLADQGPAAWKKEYELGYEQKELAMGRRFED